MEVRIVTTEKKVNVGGAILREMETQYHLTCSIRLTPEEARLFPISGNPHSQLTDEYFEAPGGALNYISAKRAVESEDSCYFKSVGQLREQEITLKRRCQEIHALLQELSGFQVEKSYMFDPAEPTEG